ncbi:extensin [Streptomyces lonarensis]|uniref:extensin n=1 Tax=Streptomyces lonarensis TaxID=700599 RepID=UPI0030C6C6E8
MGITPPSAPAAPAAAPTAPAAPGRVDSALPVVARRPSERPGAPAVQRRPEPAAPPPVVQRSAVPAVPAQSATAEWPAADPGPRRLGGLTPAGAGAALQPEPRPAADRSRLEIDRLTDRELDQLARRLISRVTRLVRTELRMDRERIGRLRDSSN